MVQAKKKKKNPDFQKVKLKVGKKLIRSHITQPKVRAQQLVLRPQFDDKLKDESFHNILLAPFSKDKNVRSKNLSTIIKLLENHTLDEESKIKCVVDNLLKMLTYQNNPVQHKIFHIIHLCLNKNTLLLDISSYYKWRVVVERLILQLSHLMSCSQDKMHNQTINYIKLIIEFYENYVNQLISHQTNSEMRVFILSQFDDISNMVKTLLKSLHTYFKWPILHEIGLDIEKRDLKVFKQKVNQYKTMHYEHSVDVPNTLSCLPLLKKIGFNFNFLSECCITSQVSSNKWDEDLFLYNNVSINSVPIECIDNFEETTHLIINYLTVLWIIETENFSKSTNYNINSNQTADVLIPCLELFINYANVCQNNKFLTFNKIQIYSYISLAMKEFNEKCHIKMLKNSDKVIDDKVNKLMSLFWNLVIIMSTFKSGNDNILFDLKYETDKILNKINTDEIAKFNPQGLNEILLNIQKSNMTEQLIKIYDHLIPTLFQENYVIDKQSSSNILLIDGLCSVLNKLFLQHTIKKLVISTYFMKITNWISLISYPLLTAYQKEDCNTKVFCESLCKLICIMRTYDKDFLTNLFKSIVDFMPQSTPQNITKLLNDYLQQLPFDNLYRKHFIYFITNEHSNICEMA